VGTDDATIWVETDGPCEVEVLGRKQKTFEVEGHHYALVALEGLEEGSETNYAVSLDGEHVWPEEGSDFPDPVIRTFEPGRKLRVSFGSCRVALPHEPPYTLPKDDHDDGLEQDALYALALRMLEGKEDWPDLLLMVGDQIYVDEGSPQVREWIRSRRDTSKPPGEQPANFEEFCALYREAWGDPVIRWLFSTVSTAMVIDDHDMHDDWNISKSWLEEMRQEDWWAERIESGLMSYWVYQHIGNLSPAHLEENEQYRQVREMDDAGPMLREFAKRVDQRREGTRWSFVRDLDGSRLIVLDDRTGRVLEDDRRSIFDDEEWQWVTEQTLGDCKHLMIATSDPYLLSPGLHHLEAWNERVCDGVWGEGMAKLGEKMRRSVDFDHWASFAMSFERMTKLLREIAAGERGDPPATITVLSGDVHHAYLAEVAFPKGSGVQSAVYQAVCSPFRNALEAKERRTMRAALSKPFCAVTRWMARLAGAKEPEIRWRFAEGPFFDNQVATIELDGRSAALRLEKTVPDSEGRKVRLETSFERRLS
jgi:hypothetical protein